MRKHIFLNILALFVLIVINSNKAIAQKKLSFGFKIGVSKAFSFQTYGKPYLRLGFSGGVLTELKLKPKLSLRTELLFVKVAYGEKIVYNDFSGGPSQKSKAMLNLSYITLPVLAKFSFGKVVKPYFLLGGFGGVSLAGNYQIPDLIIPGFADGSKQKLTLNTLYIGGIGGVGLDVKKLFIELRTNIGLTSINEYRSGVSTVDLAVGMKF